MRNLIRRSTVLAGTAALLLGSGIGVAAAQPGTATLEFTSPGQGPHINVDYGQVALEAQESQTFTVKNFGEKNSGGVRVTLIGSAEFSIQGSSSTCSGNLHPGETCEVTVVFSPTTEDTATAELTVRGNPHSTEATADLEGAGGTASSCQPDCSLFWSNFYGDSIMGANLNGTGQTFLVEDQQGPYGVAVNSGHIYWANYGTSFGHNGTIMEASLNGGDVETLVTGQNEPHGVAVAGGDIYWANSAGGTIMEASLDSCTPECANVNTLVSGQDHPYGVAVDSGHIYWANSGSTPTNGTIMEASLDSCDPECANVNTLVSGQRTPAGVAVDSGHIYWANQGHPAVPSGTIMEASLDNCDPECTDVITLATEQHTPAMVTVSGGDIYWANVNAGTIMQASLDSCTPGCTNVNTLARNQAGPVGVAAAP